MVCLLCAVVVMLLLLVMMLLMLRREMLLLRRWLVVLLLLWLVIRGAMRVVAGGPLHPQSNVLHAAVKLIGEIIDASVVVVAVDELLDLLLCVDVVTRADAPGGVCGRWRAAAVGAAAAMLLMVIVAMVVVVVIGVVDFVGVDGAQIVVDHDDTDWLLDLTYRGSGRKRERDSKKRKRNTLI